MSPWKRKILMSQRQEGEEDVIHIFHKASILLPSFPKLLLDSFPFPCIDQDFTGCPELNDRFLWPWFSITHPINTQDRDRRFSVKIGTRRFGGFSFSSGPCSDSDRPCRISEEKRRFFFEAGCGFDCQGGKSTEPLSEGQSLGSTPGPHHS